MASQQAMFAETIRAMKVALKRQRAQSPPSSSSSDNDDEARPPYKTNRGNKLLPTSRYTNPARLSTPQKHARLITHAGYTRAIISTNPHYYDSDGELADPPSDAEIERDDAFGQVKLEQLLKPLTSAGEVATHPGYKDAFTSNGLTRMVAEANEMVRRERATLWRGKRLLERLRGDGGWMGGERFEGVGDEGLLEEVAQEEVAQEEEGSEELGMLEGVEAEGLADALMLHAGVEVDGEDGDVELPREQEMDVDTEMQGVQVQDYVATEAPATEANAIEQPLDTLDDETAAPPKLEASDITSAPNPTLASLLTNGEPSRSPSNPTPTPHAMTTRTRAKAHTPPPLSRSPSITSSSIPPIHPFFLLPSTAQTSADLGLPGPEAAETRQLLLLYVQKQENIVRQAETLYAGLQRAERVRGEVLEAAKAEAHVGELSDGEDWFEGDLEKGKDEVEDLGEEEGRRVGGRRRRVVGR